MTHKPITMHIMGRQISTKRKNKGVLNVQAFGSLSGLSPSPSNIGVLKNVWASVRWPSDESESKSLTPKKVPGRNISVKRVTTCIEDVSLSVFFAISCILFVIVSMRIDAPYASRVNNLLTSAFFSCTIELYCDSISRVLIVIKGSLATYEVVAIICNLQ